MQPAPARVIALSGTRNLRDLGGYPTVDGRRTRWRTLYRSDCLDKVDDAGQTWLVQAGLRTIIDLRSEEELPGRANVFADSRRVAYRWIPFWDDPLPADVDPDFTAGYVRELDLRGERLVTMFEALLSPGALPALIHCAAGKDRTGVLVGLLLEAVGVQRDLIAQDYALSAECLGPEFVAESRTWVSKIGRDWNLWAHGFESPPERMRLTLDHLDRHHGGIQSYLVKHGLKLDQLRRLRELLVENS